MDHALPFLGMEDRFRNMIADEYLVNWIVDNLPATTRYRQTGRESHVGSKVEGLVVNEFLTGSDEKFKNGILVGLPQNGKYFLLNHVVLERWGRDLQQQQHIFNPFPAQKTGKQMAQELHFHSNPDVYVGYRIVGFEAIPPRDDKN